MAFFYAQNEVAYLLCCFVFGINAGREKAYRNAGKRLALCQISMTFDLLQINLIDKSEEQSWKKENTHFMTDTRK